MEKKTITIEVKEDINLYVSDILCWFAGYRAGSEESVEGFLCTAIDRVRELNRELKDKLD